MNRELEILQDQLRANNAHLNALFSLTDKIQEENRQILRRLSETPRRRQDEEDLVFYFYLPRRELTPEMLSRETTEYIFNEIDEPNNLACPISLEHFQPEQNVIMINRCKHIFNPNHLRTWFETKTTCPMCRCNLLEPEPQPVNRFASMATQMLSGALSSGMNDIFNELRL